MGLIDEIKVLVGKFMKSPFKTGIAAYLIWRILKPQSETVALFEGIKVLHKDEGKELVQDTATDYYGVIKGTDISYFKDLDEAEKFYHEGVRMKKLEKLHESIFKEMRPLRSGEEPVLPVGMQNLETGDNGVFNVFGTWGKTKSERVSLVSLNGNQALNISGGANSSGKFVHDQTHNEIGSYTLIKEFYGTYPDIFAKIKEETGKKSIRAYVYK